MEKRTKTKNQVSKSEKEARLTLYIIMKKIRFFEDAVFKLTSEGLILGSIHFYSGQEPVAAGVFFLRLQFAQAWL